MNAARSILTAFLHSTPQYPPGTTATAFRSYFREPKVVISCPGKGVYPKLTHGIVIKTPTLFSFNQEPTATVGRFPLRPFSLDEGSIQQVASGLWLSDEQDAFVQGIAAEFPGVPHRYCANHFLRDLAKPTFSADSHAKVQLRSKVRGWRTIKRARTPHPWTQACRVRIVQEGPTLLLALDAHQAHPQPFTADDLSPYQDATVSILATE